MSGYCECEGGVRAGEAGCSHGTFTCETKCAEKWAWLREQRKKRADEASPATDEASADDNLAKLYKRGKGFYVMGNTELALRHFREALKLDPEHSCKADYKQAKKLEKILGKLEGVMGQEVEGKGRMKALERDDQYEEARLLIEDALAISPPAVYRASLYRDLCICSTKLRLRDAGLAACERHHSLDSASASSKLLLAEANLLAERFEVALAIYRKMLEEDQHSQEAREGLQRAEKLLRRSKEADYYNTLNVSRSASPRDIKRAYHRLAVEYHPDKNTRTDKSEAEREAADLRFKAITLAYEILSDEDSRKKYDAGDEVTGLSGAQQNQGGETTWANFGGQRVHVRFQ